MQFLVNVQRGIRCTAVTIAGENDITCAEDLLDALVLAVCRDDSRILLDLSGVAFLGCAGLWALVRAR